MSLRTAVRGIALAAAGAAVVASVAALLSPGVRRAALGLVGKAASDDADAAAQPTHIVLPDRAAAPRWTDEADEASLTHDVAGDVALTGS